MWVDRDYIDPHALPAPSKLSQSKQSQSKIDQSSLKTNLNIKPTSKLGTNKQAAPSVLQFNAPRITNIQSSLNLLEQASSNHLDKWVKLREMVQHCDACELSKTRIYPIFGKGEYTAKYLFIIENLTREENFEGTVFAGPMNKFLASFLAALKIKEQDVFTSHYYKCKLAPEINADDCILYLQAQINLIKPKAIILMGLQDDQIARIKNANIPEHCTVIETISPYLVLAQPLLKKSLWNDLKQLYKIT
ncbi:hypothetical protein AwWohl_00550 [Gammaproteobacteria bacterium]|nr:hypothetical protein AwWohl_00550 [Gammaproteobacteria bacterium]